MIRDGYLHEINPDLRVRTTHYAKQDITPVVGRVEVYSRLENGVGLLLSTCLVRSTIVASKASLACNAAKELPSGLAARLTRRGFPRPTRPNMGCSPIATKS
jgi:hypothetical protein